MSREFLPDPPDGLPAGQSQRPRAPAAAPSTPSAAKPAKPPKPVGTPDERSTFWGRAGFQVFVYVNLSGILYALVYDDVKLEQFEKNIVFGAIASLWTLVNIIAGFHMGASGKTKD